MCTGKPAYQISDEVLRVRGHRAQLAQLKDSITPAIMNSPLSQEGKQFCLAPIIAELARLDEFGAFPSTYERRRDVTARHIREVAGSAATVELPDAWYP